MLFFLTVAGLLVWRRFDVPSELPVVVVATMGSPVEVGTTSRRGEVIETDAGEYLTLRIGDDLFVAMDGKTRLSADRLYDTERTLVFTRGRIVVDSRGAQPVLVETNRTQSVLTQGLATFINYDFQRLVTVAPLQGSVQAHVKGTKDYLLVPVPLNISEVDGTFSKTSFDPEKGGAAPFHTWVNAVLPPK
ncbi:hypothetical protein FJZ23_00040 [Candidatus Parcubacteria bacterium]|nr:hypothetical protein [Candidatus Parcubacteria bacterium]